MRALVDADTPIFAAALSAEGQEEWVAFSRLDKTISDIIEGSGADDYSLFVSSGVNFRKEIDPSYKANRTLPDPTHREACKQWLIEERGAIPCDGFEADDACGCEQRTDGSTIICGIDKDLLMISGLHYQWPITRKGKVVREGMFHDVTPEQGMRWFFTQMLTGDTSDNIIGIRGLGPKKAEKILEEHDTEEGLYRTVLGIYKECRREKDFHKNLDLLWIWRSYGITYTIMRDVYGS